MLIHHFYARALRLANTLENYVAHRLHSRRCIGAVVALVPGSACLGGGTGKFSRLWLGPSSDQLLGSQRANPTPLWNWPDTLVAAPRATNLTGISLTFFLRFLLVRLFLRPSLAGLGDFFVPPFLHDRRWTRGRFSPHNPVIIRISNLVQRLLRLDLHQL